MDEYKAFLNEIKQRHAGVIAEADNNAHKWYELFVDMGDETKTVDNGDTFDEAVAHYELHVKNWGAENLYMDIWTDEDTINLPQKELFNLWSKEDMPESFKNQHEPE